MKEYMTVQEVAALLNVHWQTILNYIKNGDLEAIKLDKGYRISHGALNRFTTGRTTKAKHR